MWLAEFAALAGVTRNPMASVATPPADWSGNISGLAEKARALIVQNDPDAVRAGLAEIADALDAMAHEAGAPLQTAA